MKKILLTAAALCVAATSFAVVPHRFVLPDIPGYVTLKGDMHIHTVFSDANEWPTTRVDEADYEGLDFIAMTDHLDNRHQHQVNDGNFNADKNDRNTSYEIARNAAKKYGILVIHGAELSRGENLLPGHFNLLFINDATPIAKRAEDAAKAVEKKGGDVAAREEAAVIAGLEAAKEQNAFIQWNHPDWERQAHNETVWCPLQTRVYDAGYMDGIEIVNRFTGYDPEAHHWTVEKNLTVTAGTDCHKPMFQIVDYARGEWRPMTVVFAKERSLESLREALDERRSIVYADGAMYGPAELLTEMFKACLEITDIKYSEKKVTFKMRNNSSVPLVFTKAPGSEKVIYPRLNYVNAGEELTYTIYGIDNKQPIGVNEFDMNISVQNFLSDVGTPITVSYHFSLPEKYRK